MYECYWKRSENSTGLLMIAANDCDMDGERQRWNAKAYSLLHGVLLEYADVLSLFFRIHTLLKKHILNIQIANAIWESQVLKIQSHNN